MLSRILDFVKKNLGKLSAFLVVFCVIKLTVFAAPLLLSNSIPLQADYGYLEYLLGMGALIAPVLNLGLGGAYPYFNIKQQRTGFKSLFYLHPYLSLGVFLLVLLAYSVGWVEPKIVGSAAIGLILSMQMLLSATLKSHGRIIWAVTLDGGLFTVLVLYCGWLWLHTGAVYSVSVMFTFLGVYALVLLAVCGYSLRQHFADFAWVRYREAVKFGIPLIISGFLIMLLAGSMRVFIEHFLGLEQVALYAFYFRLAAVVIMIHQVVNIALFQKIYQAAPATLDKFFALFLLFIGIISVLSCFIVPIFATNYFRLMHESIATHHKLYLLLSVQMVFWVSAALNENIIYREGLATKMNWGFGLLVPVMLGAMAGFNAMGWLNIFTITLINIVVLYLGVEVQLYVLRTQKIYFPKVRLVNIAALCLMFFLYFWAL